jgi:low temperature requirement protein LtrA
MTVASIAAPNDQRVTFVELFFDLVFVFSITQIVGILHHGITWGGIAQAVLVFWLVWWAWTQYTWALNAANTDHAGIQVATLAATAVAFFMAVSVPGAFGGGAVWFAVPYVLVRLIGLAVYARVAATDERQFTAVRIFSVISIGGLAAVVVGAVVGGEPLYWFWGLAILLDVIAASVGGREQGWNLHPSHFVERHGLIVIIALGESLIVAAAGLVATPQNVALNAVAVLAVLLTCLLWWSYFPYVRPALEKALERVASEGQAPMARDAFSLAHFPMLCGVIGVAAAFEEAIAHPDDVLALGGRAALAGGLVLFVGGTALSQWRALRSLPVLRIGLVAVTGVAIVGLQTVPAWSSLLIACLGVLAVVFVEHRSMRSRGKVQ